MAAEKREVVERRRDATSVTEMWYQNADGLWVTVGGTFGPGKTPIGQSDGSMLWESPGAAASGQKFSLAIPFSAAGDFFEIPLGRFASTVDAWTIRLATSASASFAVSLAALGGSYTDMVGGGTAPAVSAALDATDIDLSDWSVVDIPSDRILKVSCVTLTSTQGTITFHFVRA